MSREYFICKWDHDKDELLMIPAENYSISPSNCPNVIEDTMEPMMSHADGKWYDSKSTYEKSVKSYGCEILGDEVLNLKDRTYKTDSKQLKRDVHRAAREIRDNWHRPEYREKIQRLKREMLG